MVTHFLHVCEVLPVIDCSIPSKLAHVRLCETESAEDHPLPSDAVMSMVVTGFFKYWRAFPFHEMGISIRIGQAFPLDTFECSKAGCFERECVAVIEDPCEPGENTGRTLVQRHLEMLRAELNRGAILTKKGSPWSDICKSASRRPAKRLEEIKPYFLPALDASSNFGLPNVVPNAAAEAVAAIVRDATLGSTTVLEYYLNGNARRAVHQYLEALGLHSKRVGKREDGGFQLSISKPKDWNYVSSTSQSCELSLKQIELSALRSALSPYRKHENVNLTALPTKAHHNCGMKTIALLKSGMGLSALIDKYRLVAKYHPDHPLVQLSYSQTESNLGLEIVQECRGLLMELGTWQVIAWPFSKFFNHGEKHAAPLEWETARFYEKLDGSLFTLYWYLNKWHVASSRTPDASGVLHDSSDAPTLADMFWKQWKSQGLVLPREVGRRHFCYMFELTSPNNIIIVRHKESKLTCLGARNLRNFSEISCEEVARTTGWPCVSAHSSLTSLAAAITAARQVDPTVSEGFVAVDAQWRRLKIKCPGYVALHHLGGNADRSSGAATDRKCRRRRLVEIAVNNEGSEFLSYYPHLADEFSELQRALEILRSAVRRVSSGELDLANILDNGTGRRLLKRIKVGDNLDDALRELSSRELLSLIDRVGTQHQLVESVVEAEIDQESDFMRKDVHGNTFSVLEVE